MRAHVSVPVVLSAFLLAGCAQITDQIASSDAATVYAKCMADVRATAESQLISARLWLGDGTDSVNKLTDAKPFVAIERDALTQVHDRTLQCRQIVAGDKRYAAWNTPPWREYFQRGDAIYSKLAGVKLQPGWPTGLPSRVEENSKRKRCAGTRRPFAPKQFSSRKRQKQCCRQLLKSPPRNLGKRGNG